MMKEDWKYLRKLLYDGEPPIVRGLLLGYAAVWRAESDAQTIPHKKANVGRRAANIWIRQEIEALKHQAPEIVQKYRAMLERGEPKCCHTCEHYTEQGYCAIHQMQPPEDFAATVPTPCEAWESEIPF
jgi:hypothetical protein